MKAPFFASTWQRAKKQRESPLYGLVRQTYPALSPCRLNPIIANAHPASLVERVLLEMSDEDFKAARPEHLNKIYADSPAKTGVKWIDEAEKRLFGG